jgi:hypothetical protein
MQIPRNSRAVQKIRDELQEQEHGLKRVTDVFSYMNGSGKVDLGMFGIPKSSSCPRHGEDGTDHRR